MGRKEILDKMVEACKNDNSLEFLNALNSVPIVSTGIAIWESFVKQYPEYVNIAKKYISISVGGSFGKRML